MISQNINWWTGKYMKRSRGLRDILWRHFPGHYEREHEKNLYRIGVLTKTRTVYGPNTRPSQLHQPAVCVCHMVRPCSDVDHLLLVTVTSSVFHGQHAKSCPEDISGYTQNMQIPIFILVWRPDTFRYIVPFRENLHGGRDVIRYNDKNSSLIRCETTSTFPDIYLRRCSSGAVINVKISFITLRHSLRLRCNPFLWWTF
jgi:hypothetical protein